MRDVLLKFGRYFLAAAFLAVVLPIGASAASAGDFLYQDELISPAKAVNQDLICNDGARKVVCYDSTEEADAATNAPQAAAYGTGGIGVPSETPCGVRNLFEFDDVNYSGGGPFLGPAAVGEGWYVYSDQWDQETTSFKTGDYQANFNGHRDGKGANYGVQPVCANVPSLIGSGWNDRFRARKRF